MGMLDSDSDDDDSVSSGSDSSKSSRSAAKPQTAAAAPKNKKSFLDDSSDSDDDSSQKKASKKKKAAAPVPAPNNKALATIAAKGSDSDSEEGGGIVSDSDEDKASPAAAAAHKKKAPLLDSSDDDDDISDSSEEEASSSSKNAKTSTSSPMDEADDDVDGSDDDDDIDDDDSNEDGEVSDSDDDDDKEQQGGHEKTTTALDDSYSSFDTSLSDADIDMDPSSSSSHHLPELDTIERGASDEISDSDDEEPAAPQKTATAAAPAKKKSSMLADSSEDDNGSDVTSDSDDESSAPSVQKAAAAAPKKKSFKDDSDSSDDESSLVAQKKHPTPAPTPAPPTQSAPTPAPQTKKKIFLDSSDESDDSDSSDDDSTRAESKSAAAAAAAAASAAPQNTSNFDSDGDGSSDKWEEGDPESFDSVGSDDSKNSWDEGVHPSDSGSGSDDQKNNPAPRQQQQQQQQKCTACAQPAEFASDGLVACDACHQAVYCSADCALWHFKSGGHDKICKGGSTVVKDAAFTTGEDMLEDSNNSIEPFTGESEHSGMPMSQDGILAAVAMSKAQTGAATSEQKCKSCGIEPEYVSEGMQACSKCGQNAYCSKDCMEWDWNTGGHKQLCTGLSKRKADASKEGNNSDGSIEAFDTNPTEEAPQSQEEIMAALAKARADSSSNTKRARNPAGRSPLPTNCQSCGMEEEFVPEGMKKCTRCFQVPYCSVDCMEWHWKNGGHRKDCPGATPEERHAGAEKSTSAGTADHDSDGSIDPFDANPIDNGAPQSQEGILAALSKAKAESSKGSGVNDTSSQPSICKACGMNRDFLPEGLMKCARCFQVAYCTVDCMEWDWGRGGHKHVCAGVSDAERRGSHKKEAPVRDGSNSASEEGSIEPFDPTGGEHNTPQSQQGVMAAVAVSRTQNAAKQSAPAVSIDPFEGNAAGGDAQNSKEGVMAALASRPQTATPAVPQDKCTACGMDKEFVPEGLVKCPRCFQVPYCSTDCREWHWESGGHKKNCAGFGNGDQHQPKPSRMSRRNSDVSIDAFEPNAAIDAPSSKDGVMAALAASRAQTTTTENTPSLPQDKCASCGMEKEFVPEGMVNCPRCFQVPYCSSDCLEWHWDSGGHMKDCKGVTDMQKKTPPTKTKMSRRTSDASIDACELTGAGGVAPQSKEGVLAALSRASVEASGAPVTQKHKPTVHMDKCNSCGMDAEFVSEGMRRCSRCFETPYCSLDCMSWDWDKGGHKQICSGAVGPGRKPATKSRALATPLSEKCKACSMEAEFIPEEMKTCPRCSQQVYCSDDCLQWDWQHGDHKQECPGRKGADRIVDREIRMVPQDDVSDASIDAFGGDPEDGTPQSQDGVLAALSKARAEAANHQPKNAPPQSRQSLRDQITGGNDKHQEREIYSEAQSPPVSQRTPVNMLKVELERIKRQYNDALLSKASLERALKNTPRDTAAAGLPARNRDGFHEAIDSFLKRLEGLLHDTEPARRSHEKPLHEEQLNALRGGLEAQRNRETDDRNALRSASTPGIPSSSGWPDRSKHALLNELHDKWDGIIAESDNLRVQLDRANGEREQLLVTNASSNRVLHEKEETLAQVCGAILELEKEVLRIIGEQKQLEAENASLRGRLDRAHDEHEQVAVAKDASDKLVHDKDSFITKLCQAIEDLEAEVARIGSEKTALGDELKQTSLVLAKHRQSRNKLEQSFQDAEDEMRGLRKRLRQMDSIAEATAAPPTETPTETYMRPAASSTARSRDLPDYLRQAQNTSIPAPVRRPVHAARVAQRLPPEPPADNKSLFATSGMPSRRQDEVGRAIRERTGAAPVRRRDERFGAVPLPDDGQQPAGSRMFEDYARPMKSQSQMQVTGRNQRIERLAEDDRYGRSAPWPTGDSAMALRGINETKQRLGEPTGQGLPVRNDDMHMPPQNEVHGLWRRQPQEPSADIIVQLPLTPNEQRMAYIQQRIAQAVDSASQNVTDSAPAPYGQPRGSGKRTLRPQYGRPASAVVDPSLAVRLSVPGVQPPPLPPRRLQTGTPSNLSSAYRHTALQPPPSYSQTSQLPSLSRKIGLSASRNTTTQQTTPGKSSRQQEQQQQHPRQHQGRLGGPPTNRTRLDPGGGYRARPPQNPPYAAAAAAAYRPTTATRNSPRYAVTHQVDPKQVRDDRWRNVLTSSRVLS